MKIEIKSWKSGSVLFEFEKENNTINDTVIEAIKAKADLSYANLSYADLSYAETDKRYIQISCIGSAKRMTTFCFDDDKITCGCFSGTLDEFEAQVKKVHVNSEQYMKEYIGVDTLDELLIPEVHGYSESFWEDVQVLHDGEYFWTDKGLSAVGEIKVRKLTEKYE